MDLGKIFFEREIRSYEKKIETREKSIANLEKKIAVLKAQCDAGKISKGTYEKRKDGHINSIHGMKGKIKILRGAIAKEHRAIKESEHSHEKGKKETKAKK
jgi:chromosome segregation ATPase